MRLTETQLLRWGNMDLLFMGAYNIFITSVNATKDIRYDAYPYTIKGTQF